MPNLFVGLFFSLPAYPFSVRIHSLSDKFCPLLFPKFRNQCLTKVVIDQGTPAESPLDIVMTENKKRTRSI